MILQVVLGVARAFYYLGPPSDLPNIIPPLLRLLHVSREIERVVLTNLVLISSSLSVSCLYSVRGSVLTVCAPSISRRC